MKSDITELTECFIHDRRPRWNQMTNEGQFDVIEGCRIIGYQEFEDLPMCLNRFVKPIYKEIIKYRLEKGI